MYEAWDDDMKSGRRRSMSLPDYAMPPSFFEDGTNSPTSDSDEDGPPGSFGFRQGFSLESIPEVEPALHSPSRLKFEHPSSPKTSSPRVPHQLSQQQPSGLQFQQTQHQQQHLGQPIPHFTLNLQGLYSEFQEDAIRFDVMYQVHFHKIFEAVRQIRLDSIRDEVLSFWPKTRRFFTLFQNPIAMHQILNIDALFYQSLITLLIPEPFHYLPTEVSTLAIELSRLLPVWLHNATQFALPLAFSEEKIRVVKQYCTVLHKRALINNLGGRVANQLQSGQESYGLNDGGKRKAEETDSKYTRMLSDWQQIDFSFITYTFAFDSGEWEMLEGTGFHSETLVPPETIDQMASLLQRRAGINEWTDWLRDAVLSRCPTDSTHGDSSSIVGRPIHQLVLKWSLFLSNILTELTLIQAKSVKQFRLLFEWIEAVLSHQMEIQFAKTEPVSKTQSKPDDNLGFTASTGSFWREQTRQLKQQVEFLTGKIALLEQQLQATKLAPSTPPTYFPSSPKLHRSDETTLSHNQAFSPHMTHYGGAEGYPSPSDPMGGTVRRPSLPFSFNASHRPRTNSQPSPEIRFSDWDEQNEESEDMKEDKSEGEGSVMMKDEGEKGDEQDVVRNKKPLRKARSGSGLERRRPAGGRGSRMGVGAMYIDNEHNNYNNNNTTTTTNTTNTTSQPFLTMGGFMPNQQQQQQQDKKVTPHIVSNMHMPMYHVTHNQHSFSQPTSPTFIGMEHNPAGLGGSAGAATTTATPSGPGGGLGGSGERYLSAPVPRGTRIRSNSNPAPFIDVSELWMGQDRTRKLSTQQPKQEQLSPGPGGGGGPTSGVNGFAFTKSPFEDASASPTNTTTTATNPNNTGMLNFPYFNKNFSVKTGE